MKIREIINKVDIRKFRFWIQLITFIIFVYGGYFAINLGREIPMFSCGYNHSCGGSCFFLGVQHQLARPWDRLFSMASIGVLTGFLTFILWFIFFNKAWCGYMCPIGTLQDWITSFRKFLKIPYATYTQDQYKWLKKIKYIFLVIVLIFPLMIGIEALNSEWRGAFCKMCPARIITPMFSGDFSQWYIDFSSNTAIFLTAFGVGFTALFFVGSFIKKRFFCFFCPMSAMHYILSPLALLKLKKDGQKCTKCGDCYNVCDMQIKDIADDVKSTNILRDDCIFCLKCVAACPEEDALKVDIVKWTIFKSTKGGFAKRMDFEKED